MTDGHTLGFLLLDSLASSRKALDLTLDCYLKRKRTNVRHCQSGAMSCDIDTKYFHLKEFRLSREKSCFLSRNFTLRIKQSDSKDYLVWRKFSNQNSHQTLFLAFLFLLQISSILRCFCVCIEITIHHTPSSGHNTLICYAITPQSQSSITSPFQ